MDHDRADFDNIAWDRNDAAWEASQSRLRDNSTTRLMESLTTEKFRERVTLVPPLIAGGYNVIYRMHLEESSNDVLVRVPGPNLAQFPDEKTLAEVAAAKYIAQNTLVPVPKVYYYGLSSQSPHVGPFIIMQYIEKYRSLSDALTRPSKNPDEPHVLNPHISEATLMRFYSQMASYLLELSQHHFPRIGSLVETGPNSYTVAGRPITLNMNNMIQLANIPRTALPPQDKTYSTADEWYIALAEMHIAQLVFQHNDLVSTEDDCRNRYVARHLFLKLAKKGQLSTFGFAEDNWSVQSKSKCSELSPTPAGSSSFRLWCDDLRAGNVLLNKADDIVAVIDWEFTYIAPTQFVLDPPWWLLLDVPEMWPLGIENWKEVYNVRLQTWLHAIEEAEKSVDVSALQFKLSTYMRESWETGRFWLNYAARKSWAFDTIYWKYLDEKFFGERAEGVSGNDLWKSREHLLTQKERRAMEPFVRTKMEESKERILVDWDLDSEQMRRRLAEVLFDDN